MPDSQPEPKFEVIAEHLIKAGESLGAIAYRYYRSAARQYYMAIYEANREVIGDNPNRIPVGKVILIPRLEDPNQLRGKIIARYTVQQGDTLSHIALWHYGSAEKPLWEAIYRANKGLIGADPAFIRPGQVLEIPDPGDRAWFMRSDSPMKLTFKNEAVLNVNIYWVNYNNEEVYRLSLNAGESASVDTYETHRWVVRDWDSRSEIASAVAMKRHPQLTISSEHLRPIEPGEEIQIVVWNPTSLNVDLMDVGPGGGETLLHGFDTGDSEIIPTRVNAVLCARERETRKPVWTFIVTADRRREYTVEGASFDGQPATHIEMYNHSPLDVAVYWKYFGKEVYFRTLTPYQYFFQNTFATHEWIFRDAASGMEIARTRAGSAPESFYITANHLQSAGNPRKLESFRLVNDTPLAVDVHRIERNGRRTLLQKALPAGEVYESGQLSGEAPQRKTSSSALHVYDVLMVSESSTSSLVACVIASPEAEQERILRLRTYPTGYSSILEFTNKTWLSVKLSWFNQDGEEKTLPGKLDPGQTAWFPTSGSSPWLARDLGSGQVLAFHYASEQDRSLEVGLPEPPEARRVVSLTLGNGTPLEVEVYRLQPGGGEKHLTASSPPGESDQEPQPLVLLPGDKRKIYTFAHHPLVFRERMSGSVIEHFIPADDQEQNFLLFLGRFASTELARISFANHTLLDLVVRSAAQEVEGSGFRNQLRYRDTLSFETELYQTMLVIERQSDTILDYVQLTQDGQEIKITPEMLRPRHERTPVRVSFENTTRYDVQLCRVDEQGAEHNAAEIESGATQVIDTYFTHVFRAREKASGSEIFTFIASNETEQSCLIEDRQVVRGITKERQLLPGEVAFFPDVNFEGQGWILRNSFADFSAVRDMDESVSSIKVGPGTGVSLYSDRDYRGKESEIFLDISDLTMQKVSDDEISSVKVWEIISARASGIRAESGLWSHAGQWYYRSVLSFPMEVMQVDVTALNEVTVRCGQQEETIDSVRPMRLSPNAAGKLVLLIKADKIGVPALRLHTNTMKAFEYFLVFPDEEIYRNVSALPDNALWEGRSELGLQADEQTCTAVEKALKNVSASVSYSGATLPGEKDAPQLDPTGMEYDQWIAYLGDKNSFQSLSPSSYVELTRNAVFVDASLEQFFKSIGKFFKRVGKAVVDTGKKVYQGVKYVATRVYENVLKPIGGMAEELFNKAVQYGQAAVDIVARFGEKALGFIEKVGKTGLNALTRLGKNGWEALMALKDGDLERLAQLGVDSFNTLIDAGADVAKFTAKLGKEGFQALKDLGSVGLGMALDLASTGMQKMADVLGQIDPTLGKALEVTLGVGGEAVKFVLNLGEQIGAFTEMLLDEIAAVAGQVIGTFVGWIASAFGWDEVIETQQKMAQIVNASFDDLQGLVPKMRSLVGGKTPRLKAMLDEVIKRPPASAPPGPGASVYSSITGGVVRLMSEAQEQLDWLISELSDNLPSMPARQPAFALNLPGELSGELQQLFSDASLDGFMPQQQLQERMISRMGQAAENPERILEIIQDVVMVDLFSMLRGMLDDTLDLFEKGLDLVFRVLQAALDAIRRFINAELDIPFVSEFYEGLTGHKLTLLNASTLLAAIPATVISNAILGHPPFQGYPSLALSSQPGLTVDDMKKRTTLVYGSIKIVLGALYPGIAVSSYKLEKKQKLDKMDGLPADSGWGAEIAFFTWIAWLLELLAQLAGHPGGYVRADWDLVGDQAGDAWGSDPLNYDNWNSFFWLWLWGVLGLGMIGLPPSPVPGKAIDFLTGAAAALQFTLTLIVLDFVRNPPSAADRWAAMVSIVPGLMSFLKLSKNPYALAVASAVGTTALVAEGSIKIDSVS